MQWLGLEPTAAVVTAPMNAPVGPRESRALTNGPADEKVHIEPYVGFSLSDILEIFNREREREKIAIESFFDQFL